MKKEIRQAVRHGDLDLIPVDGLPAGAKRGKSNILAFGEVTGHHHTVQTLERKPLMFHTATDGKQYVEVTEDGATLDHPEHGILPLGRGVYRKEIEKEYNPFEDKIREVQD